MEPPPPRCPEARPRAHRRRCLHDRSPRPSRQPRSPRHDRRCARRRVGWRPGAALVTAAASAIARGAVGRDRRGSEADPASAPRRRSRCTSQTWPRQRRRTSLACPRRRGPTSRMCRRGGEVLAPRRRRSLDPMPTQCAHLSGDGVALLPSLRQRRRAIALASLASHASHLSLAHFSHSSHQITNIILVPTYNK